MIAAIPLCLLLFTSPAISASLDKAKMLRRHRLVSDAKKELIEVIFNKQNDKNKAEAYYILGTVAFEEDDISAALETWTQLVTDFPESDQANLVKDKINQLTESVGETSRTVVENAIAQSYLRHAEFWSEKEKRKKFTIDSSFISEVEVAVSWYDKVIQEFPNTEASRHAYEGKVLTLIGKIQTLIDEKTDELKELKTPVFESTREYVKNHFQEAFNLYMPQLLDTFSAFERNFAEALYLQKFRYQIAQIYLYQSNLDQSRHWLNQIIEQSGENNTFYRLPRPCRATFENA